MWTVCQRQWLQAHSWMTRVLRIRPQELEVDYLYFQKSPYRGFLWRSFTLVLRKACKTEGRERVHRQQSRNSHLRKSSAPAPSSMLLMNEGQLESSSYWCWKVKMLPWLPREWALEGFLCGFISPGSSGVAFIAWGCHGVSVLNWASWQPVKHTHTHTSLPLSHLCIWPAPS